MTVDWILKFLYEDVARALLLPHNSTRETLTKILDVSMRFFFEVPAFDMSRKRRRCGDDSPEEVAKRFCLSQVDPLDNIEKLKINDEKGRW